MSALCARYASLRAWKIIENVYERRISARVTQLWDCERSWPTRLTLTYYYRVLRHQIRVDLLMRPNLYAGFGCYAELSQTESISEPNVADSDFENSFIWHLAAAAAAKRALHGAPAESAVCCCANVETDANKTRWLDCDWPTDRAEHATTILF